MKTLTALMAVTLLNKSLSAQDISLGNPSIEGPPKAGNVPPPWIRAFESPDTQPGYYGISLPASHGKTYAGFILGKRWQEGIFQQLPTPMKAGSSYQVSFDLAFPPRYDTLTLCTGTLAVYGSNSTTEKGDILWQSGTFNHENWTRYTASFRPEKDYAYILFMPYLPPSCGGRQYTGALIDNVSSKLAQVPELQFEQQPTCKGKSTGMIKVIPTGGQAPYTYHWQHGPTTGQLKDLSEGTYTVTVNSANGTSVSRTVNVNAYTLEAKAVPKEPLCHGDANGSLALQPLNGVPPYQYGVGNEVVFQGDSIFSNLRAGTYTYGVADAVGCVMRAKTVLPEPATVALTNTKIHHVSCIETIDGRILLHVSGGTPPYTYSLNQGPWQADSSFHGLDAGQYALQVKDQNNCAVTGQAEIIRYIRECAVFMPNAFSPNGDGINDIFRAKVHDDVRDYRLAVYNRWGELMFESRDAEAGWDGTFKGQPANTEVYAWVLTYTDSHQQARKQTGSVTLIR